MAIELPENLKQKTPLSNIEEAAYLWILVTAEHLKAETAELFKQQDLTAPQYNVLRILRGAGAEGLCGREVGDRMITRDSDITRMLDRLEGRGLIRRERQTEDRRFVLAFITKAGLDTLAKLDRPIVAWHRKRLAHLSESEMRTMTGLLKKVLKG